MKAKTYKGAAINTAKLTRYKSGGEAIKIIFPFSKETISNIKTIPGYRYHSEMKFWSCPLSIEAIEKLLSFEFHLDEGLIKYYNTSKLDINNTPPITIPNIRGTLFPYQNIGVAVMEKKQGNVLLADEMGLGKTIQALNYLQLHPELRPVVIVCPGFLKINWARETRQWVSDAKIQIISGTKIVPIFGKIIIVNYEILSNDFNTITDRLGEKRQVEILRTGWIDFLIDINPKVLIIDEAHFIKNKDAQRTKAVMKLAQHVEHKIGITGTPFENHPAEIWNIVNVIDKTLFPNNWKFLHRYCNPRHNGFGWDFTGHSHEQELHDRLVNSIMIRRLKKDVLKDLPEKTRIIIPLEIDNEEEYSQAENAFIEYLDHIKDEKIRNLLERNARIEALKQLCIKGKLKNMIAWISNFLESGDKLVVFCCHTFLIDQIMKAFPKISVRFDGSIPMHKRQIVVDTFQQDPTIKLFVGMLDKKGQPAGIGITLTAAYATATLELQDSPGVHKQAEDRVHRISQKFAVFSYYLVALNTIEEKLMHRLDEKMKTTDLVLDDIETSESDLFEELIEDYLKNN